jgi:hypothetical protein
MKRKRSRAVALRRLVPFLRHLRRLFMLRITLRRLCRRRTLTLTPTRQRRLAATLLLRLRLRLAVGRMDLVGMGRTLRLGSGAVSRLVMVMQARLVPVVDLGGVFNFGPLRGEENTVMWWEVG